LGVSSIPIIDVAGMPFGGINVWPELPGWRATPPGARA
jgi:hypothetical protein